MYVNAKRFYLHPLVSLVIISFLACVQVHVCLPFLGIALALEYTICHDHGHGHGHGHCHGHGHGHGHSIVVLVAQEKSKVSLSTATQSDWHGHGALHLVRALPMVLLSRVGGLPAVPGHSRPTDTVTARSRCIYLMTEKK
jgi:hypothetical protein